MQAFYADSISEHLSKTPEGFLIARSCPVARTGHQTYTREETKLPGAGLVQVNRTPEEVFSPATIASFEGKPIVSPHPPTFITAENIAGYQKGHVQHVRKGPTLPDGEHSLIADLVITDATLISRIESNAIRELSAGYDYRLEPDGEGLKMVQIRGNHVAVVPSGRAGNHVRILDANLAEEEVPPVDFKVVKESYNDAREFFLSLGWTAPKQAKDAESDAVKRNEETAKESLKLDERTTDAKTKDSEKEASVAKEAEEKKAAKDAEEEKEMKDRKARDAEEKEEKEERKATDAKLSRIADALEKLVEKEEEKKGKDGEYDEEKAGEDSDLICTETLPPNERPKNPIPGADTAIEVLRRLAPIVAQTDNKKAIDALNAEYRTLRGIKKAADKDGYREIANRGDRAKEQADRQATDGKETAKGQDAAAVSAKFVENAGKFLGRNPKDVKLDDGGKQ